MPEHPAWITLQLVDLLSAHDGLPIISVREIDRRTRYLKLHGTAERMLVVGQFDLKIAACREDVADSRRPEAPDEDVRELMDTEHVRPRTFAEIAQDLREESTRAYLPERASDGLAEAATLAERGAVDAAAG